MLQAFFQPVAQALHPGLLFLHVFQREFRGDAKPDDGRGVFRAGAPAAFLVAAAQQGAHPHAATDVERTDTFGRMQLMAGERQHVDFRGLQIDRHLADGLHRIGVEQRTGVVGEIGELLDRKDRAGFIVRPHDRGDCGFWPQRFAVGIDVEPAAAVHRRVVYFNTAVLLQPLAQGQDRRMFHHGCDDFVAAGLGFQRRQQCGVVGFGAAAGVDDLVIEFGAEQGL